MKSIVSVLAFTVVAALALTGCSPDNSSDSATPPSTNSSLMDTNGMSGTNTISPATNSVPEVSTNLAAATNQ